MRARLEALRIPERSHRYFAVDMTSRPDDPHHMCLPAAEQCYALASWWAEHPDAAPGLFAQRANQLRSAAAMVGLFWSHRATELDVEPPRRLTDDDLQAYSIGVQKELTDAGYTVVQILALGVACKRHLNSFIHESEGVSDVVDFGAAGTGDPTPSV